MTSKTRFAAFWLLAAAGLATSAVAAYARSFAPPMRGASVSEFRMLDAPVAPPTGSMGQRIPSWLSGSTVCALGDGAIAIDGDSGSLLRLDQGDRVVASRGVGHDAGQLVCDTPSARVFVADRRGHRIAVYRSDRNLTAIGEFATRTEPFGLALTPDRKRLLVTTVADQALSAYSTSTGEELWSIAIGEEPRGVAISPTGKEATVGFLTTSAVARVKLGKKPSVRYVALDRPSARAANEMVPGGVESSGRSFARNGFAVAYVSSEMAIVPHQESTPALRSSGSENVSVYGGGSGMERPIAHRLAFIAPAQGGYDRVAKAEIDLHAPRAIAYDSRRDIAYVAAYGSDEIIAIGDASRPSAHLAWQGAVHDGAGACGPNGIATTPGGGAIVFCALSRKVARIDHNETRLSSTLTRSRFSESAQRGRALFRLGNSVSLSASGVMACASCHPEGRTDGLSWRIGGAALQTPLLVGRTIGAHPFKWDGGDENIQASLRNTVTRLGGRGISESQADDIAAYLSEAYRPIAPRVKDASRVARGEKLFNDRSVGCASCHSGKLRTNRSSYDFADDLEKVDTPSLIGLAASAPYYHDGSAATLKAVLLENGSVHGMGRLDHLDRRDVDDLVAYLRTL